MEGIAQHRVDYSRQVRPGIHSVSHGGDEGLYVEFYMKSVKQEFETEKQGRYIGKDMPFVKIMYPGDRTKTTDRPALEEDQYRFARQWAAFKNQEVQTQTGTPLEEWAALTKSEVLELKSINIHTIDQLAATPDTAMTWLGSRELRNKAQSFLKQATDGSEISRLISENSNLKADMQFLKEQVISLGGKGGRAPDTAQAERTETEPKKIKQTCRKKIKAKKAPKIIETKGEENHAI